MAEDITKNIERADELLREALKHQKELNRELSSADDIWSAITKNIQQMVQSSKSGETHIAKELSKRASIQRQILDNKSTELRINSELSKRAHLDVVENVHKNTLKELAAGRIRLQNQKSIGLLVKAMAKDLGEAAGNIIKSTNWIKITLGYFRLLDDEAARFRMRMGIWRTQSIDIEQSARSIYGQMIGIGANIEMVYKAAEAMGRSFGTIYSYTPDIGKALTSWQANLGISAESGAELLRVFSQLSGKTSQSQVNMGAFLSSMTQAAGIPLNETMVDIARASATSYSMLSRSPIAIARAAVEARRLGTTLDSITKSGKQMLDFTESINKEMEASVLIGAPINLQRARELSYRRDILGLNREIMRLAKNELDFNRLDRFQQEAFASALGLSVDEIAKMLNAEREIQRIKTFGSLSDKERLRKLEEMEAANNSIAQDMGKQAQLQIQQRANQAQLTILSNQWNQIVYQVVEALFPLTNVLLQAVNIGLKFAAPLIKVAAVSGIIWKYWGQISRIGSLVVGTVAKIAPGFARFLGPIGIAITGLMALWNISKRIYNIINDPNMNIGQKILAGLQAVAEGIFDTLIGPFKAVFGWLEKTFLGQSPSLIGEMIVAGIKAVGGSLFNNLILPFKLAKMAISRIFGTKSIAGETPTPGIIDADSASATEVRSAAATASGAERVYNQPKGVPSSGVIDAINSLRQDLINGKIAVYLDSQLVSLHSNRNTQFRRGFGTNNSMVGS